MEGLPVTIRLLDPPLHEFLPSAEELAEELRKLKEVDSAFSTMENISDAMKFLDPAFRESLGLLDHVVTDIVEIKEKRLDKKLIRKAAGNPEKGERDDGGQPHAGPSGSEVGNHLP